MARKLVSKVSKPFADWLLEWEAEEPLQRYINISLRKKTSTLQGNSPLCWDRSPSPGEFLIHPKGQTPAQLDIQGTIGKYTGREALKAPPDTSIDTGNDDEILEPEFHIPTDAHFVIAPSLDKVVDPLQIVHTFLPIQGEIECLLKQINRKVL